MKTRHTIFRCALTAIACLFLCSEAWAGGKMSFKIAKDGTISMKADGRTQIERSALGLLMVNGAVQAPTSATVRGQQIIVSYQAGDVTLDRKVRANGSIRLQVAAIPDEADAFIFGPFSCPNTENVGDCLGAAWHKDGSAVCIQSLNPKTMGECEFSFENKTGFPSPAHSAAGMKDKDKAVLSCCARNMTRPLPMIGNPQVSNNKTTPIPAPEGSIVGSAIVLTYGASDKALLEDIGQMELEEGLPHPTIDGEWAKTSPHAKDLYFVVNGGDTDSQIRMAERAGIHWIYFSDPFKSWGHFDISTDQYPGGMEDFKATIQKAKDHGINIGFHTLSNFIHTYDPYVSPVPDKELLSYDPTPVTREVSKDDSLIYIGEQLSYDKHFTLGLVRLDDELIEFKTFDKSNMCLTGCKRGACGTNVSAHPKGTLLKHMADHGYRTLFPTAKLQDEMADNLARLIKESKIRRMSFDGLEGCAYPGFGEYGPSSYVQRVWDNCGGDLICDASRSSHYRWHAHSYFNWGEPWYDWERRGGTYNYRAQNQDYFHRNLLPGMLGWYCIYDSRGRFEPTLPETLEYMLARNVAYDAGSCLVINSGESDKMNSYLDKIKDWSDFRFNVQVPDSIRKLMQDERTYWHLEKENGKWVLSQLFIDDYDLGYLEQNLTMESGTTGYQVQGEKNGEIHHSMVHFDRSSPSKNIPDITEPLYCRIRIGTPEFKGQLKGLHFCGEYYGTNVMLGFDNITAQAGDYLEYHGGTTLYHYDKDYNLIEKSEATQGNPLTVSGGGYTGYTLEYSITGQPEGQVPLRIMFKHIRTRQKFEFNI